VEKQALKSVLKEASEIVAELPEHLQEKAFALAVDFLVDAIPADTKSWHEPHKPRHGEARLHASGEHDAVSDFLKVGKSNSDKYIIFLHDLEHRGEAATPNALLSEFKSYKQDKPGNVHRDLQNLSAADLAKPASKERGAPWELRGKGRKRYAELAALLQDE
jgi:hypothetical protein